MGQQVSRKTKNTPKSSRASKKPASAQCSECSKKIPARDQALFVEEEVGRVFCSEACIVTHFTPEIEKLEREYGRNVTPQDLTGDQREKFAHLRWMTIEDPSEIWAERLPSGDLRYTLVGEYKPETEGGSGPQRVFGVAICLMLREEPSFLFLAFVTQDRHLVDVFRRGEKLKRIQESSSEDDPETQAKSNEAKASEARTSDRLAEPWTEADSVRAQLTKNRKDSDIPVEDFGFYQNCLEETLQEPTELWSFLPKAAKRVYHFIRRYEHDQPYWYVVIARDTTDESQIEIVDAFPTRDETLVRACRHGKKENLNSSEEAEEILGATGTDPVKKNVH